MPPRTTKLTRDLGVFIGAFRTDGKSRAFHPAIKQGLVDCIGTMIAGATCDGPRIVQETFGADGSEASICLGAARASAPTAALINGTAAHVLDYDDVALQGHISAVLMPAIFAEAEALGLAGETVLSAYLVGYECWAELIGRQMDQVHRKGWHPTGVFGPVGAAAACAYLHGLTARQASHALAIAASHSGGIVANFGSMTKAYHAGRAARTGVVSARLARAGMTGSEDALEGPTGLLRATAPHGQVDVVAPVHAAGCFHFGSHGLTLKKFPTCLSTHRAAECVMRLHRQTRINVPAIRRIEVSMSRRNAEILFSHAPRTALEAKFSAEFAVATAIVTGRLGLQELDDAHVDDPAIRELIGKITVRPDEREDPDTGYAPVDEVCIEMADGSCLSQRVDATPGSPASPLSPQELRGKFDACLDYAGASGDRDTLFRAVMRLETLSDIRRISRSRTAVPVSEP